MTKQSASAPVKPSLFKKLLALLLMLLFVAIAGGVVFYAKKTQQDMTIIAANTKSTLPDAPTGAHNDKAKPTQGLIDLNGADMVVVDNVSPPTPTDTTADPTQDKNAQDAADLQSQSTAYTQNLAEKTAMPDSANAQLIEALQKQVTALSAKLTELEKKTSDIQENSRQGMQNDIALLLATSQLQSAINSGHPFIDQLALLRKLSAKNSELDGILQKLEPASAIGIADIKTLQAEFQQVAKNILQLSNRNAGSAWAQRWAGDGIVADSFGSLASLLVVRRIDDVSGNSIDGAISQIETALQAQNLPAADRAINALPKDLDSAALIQWRDKFARKYLAEQSLQNIQQLILGRLQSNSTVN